jgi:hypothetical protein
MAVGINLIGRELSSNGLLSKGIQKIADIYEILGDSAKTNFDE